MTRTSSHKIISLKMEILVEQRDYLQAFVDETNKVLHLATSWLSNEDTTKIFTSSDMCKMIDDKLDFLVSADFCVGCEEAAIGQESMATRSPLSAPKSTDQLLPAGHVYASGVTGATDELKTVLSQVNVMQDTMSSLSTSSKMLSEKQLAMEKLVESWPDKYYKADEQEKLREIEGELEDIKEKHKTAAIQQDKRMTSAEKKIQAVTDTQSDIIENCHQQQTKIKDQKKETEKLKTQSQQFTKDLRDALVNNVATNKQMSALEEEIKALKESLEELSTRFEEHGSSIEELSTKFEEHGSSLEELTQRSDGTLKALSTTQKSESEKFQKLEEKFSALENSWSETTVENGKLCQDVEAKYEMVCQVVTDRLVPLERLRDIFNGKLDARTESIKKLDGVCDQMTDFLPKFSQVEQATQRQAIGFSAYIYESIKSFTNKENFNFIFPEVMSNIGDHYDSKTGEFTAPLDGLYAAYFFIDISKSVDSEPVFSIMKKLCFCKDVCYECWCSSAQIREHMTQASTFGVVEMKANEKLLVKCRSQKCSLQLQRSGFVCFKIF